MINPRRCEHCDADPKYLEEVDGHPDFRKCLICTKLTCIKTAVHAPEHLDALTTGEPYLAFVDPANGPNQTVVSLWEDGEPLGMGDLDEAEDDLECPECQEAELVALRGHDPSGKDQGPIVGFYCRACNFRHTGSIASVQARRQSDNISTAMVERLLAEDQRKGAPGGGGQGCRVRRRPKAGEKAAWKEARRNRGTDSQGAGPGGMTDAQIERARARKDKQLPPTRVGTEEEQVLDAVQAATGANKSEAVRECIRSVGKASVALAENDQLRARVAELEAQLAGEVS